MANLKNYMPEIVLTIISFIFLWFIATNVNSNLGLVMLWALGISFFLLLINILIFDKSVRVTFQKEKGKWLEAIFSGLVGYGIVLIASYVIFNVWGDKQSLYSVMKSFGATNPAFANSVIINFIALGFLIPFAETNLFSRLLEWIADMFNIPINKDNMFNIKTLFLIISLGILFAIFHTTAKGVGSTASLILVGVMMVVSLFLIILKDGETRSAIFLHIFANGIAAAIFLVQGGVIKLG